MTLTFQYLDQDPDDMRGLEKGFVCRRINAIRDGQAVGYIKIAYIPEASLPDCFPTIWHWYRIMGTCFDTDDLADAWFAIHWSVGVTPASLKGKLPYMRGLSRKMAPDEATIQSDLAALEKLEARWGGEWRTVHDWYADFCRSHVDRPIVDYIKVEEACRRQGIGTALYNAGARWLAERWGLALHASGLQSNEAKATWDAMQASGQFPIELRKRPWDDKKVPVFDYRGFTEAETA